uniref:Thioredoxin domain-containing protein n=1 Tax=Amphora coffeiformis TaxID=265554 RepID=A0A7S3LCU6_9STRA|mmetsp:Transcript_17132/g.32005  ORF Transcript_17132/g.32005 Transcript_17132/m.32005 type:complete len:151 (+) Transcript_17132:354-806(+)|eukprot:scaffold145_cov173-Amphora_coffeaeformis.AAC.6
MPVYEAIAAHFHSEPDLKVSVGKVNGDSERALASRFGVKAYPTFYLIDGYSVYKFEGSRSMESIVTFVQSKYREQPAIPFLSSPMGPMGMCQGAFLSGAYGAFHAVEWLQEEMGFSPFFAVMILFGSIFIGIFITIVVSAVLLTPKEKRD